MHVITIKSDKLFSAENGTALPRAYSRVIPDPELRALFFSTLGHMA